MPRRNDIAAILIEQLQTMVDDLGKISLIREKPWASITFSGTRHYFSATFSNAGIDDALVKRLDGLPDAEFILPGHFVADLIVKDYRTGDTEIALEVLTIIDPVVTDSGDPLKS